MKKIIFLLFISFFSITNFTVSNAEDINLIEGKPMLIERTGAYTNLVTDNDLSTGLTFSGNLTFTFENPVNVVRYEYYGITSSGYTFLRFYDSNSKQIGTGNIAYYPISNVSLKNVKKVVLYFQYSYTAKELKIFGSYPPNDVSGLEIYPTMNSALITFIKPVGTLVDHYEVDLNGNLIENFLKTESYTITGLAEDTEYTVEIVTVDTSGNRSIGVSKTFKTIKDNTPPGDVTSISVLPSYTEAEVTFTKPSDPDVDHYEVYLNGNLIENNLKNESYKIAGLAEDTEYTVMIVSVDTSGNKSNGNFVSFRTKKFVPQPPQNVGSSPGEDENGKYLMITWNEVPKAKSYKIYIDGNFIAEVPAGTTQYKAYGYDPNRDHRVEVTTIYDSGEESDPAKAPDKWDQTRDKMELNVRDLLVMTFQFLMIFWNVILLILASILGPKIYRFLKSIAKEKGVKF
ncbi:MAG: hypothetical protein IMW85_00895 [Thermicanus sp.]|nr:hypothetical protein [Thermicanus sp.]